jgi:hypothetical protein
MSPVQIPASCHPFRVGCKRAPGRRIDTRWNGMNNQGCRRERVHHVRQRLVKEAEPFTLDGRQRLAPDIWVTVSLLFLVSEMLKPDRICTRYSIKVDLSRPVLNKVNYIPSRFKRTSDQRLRYREHSSETPSPLFLRSKAKKQRSSDSPRESLVRLSEIRHTMVWLGYSGFLGVSNRTWFPAVNVT